MRPRWPKLDQVGLTNIEVTVQSLIEIIHTFTLTDIDQGDGGVQLADLAQALAEVLGRRRHQDDSNAEDVVEVEEAAAVLDEAGDYSDTTVLAPGSVSGQAGEAENADVGVVETLKTVEKEEAEADQLDTEVRLSGIRQILLERLVGQLGQVREVGSGRTRQPRAASSLPWWRSWGWARGRTKSSTICRTLPDTAGTHHNQPS